MREIDADRERRIADMGGLDSARSSRDPAPLAAARSGSRRAEAPLAAPAEPQAEPQGTSGGGGPTESTPALVVLVIYEGMDDTCSICRESFEHGQRVCRHSCRHVFHAACWEDGEN